MSTVPDPVKAIETRYAGCHFRSRLEARWAVFFDHLGMQWEYEPQGFEHGIHDTIHYLPDFYLPTSETWIEVKGSQRQLLDDFEKLAGMLDWGSPIPHVEESYGHDSHGLLLLGPIPRSLPGQLPVHGTVQHHKGLMTVPTVFSEKGPRTLFYCESVHHVPAWGRPSQDWYYDASWGSLDERQVPPCMEPEYYDFGGTGMWRINQAYDAARSARFEHGQSGAT